MGLGNVDSQKGGRGEEGSRKNGEAGLSSKWALSQTGPSGHRHSVLEETEAQRCEVTQPSLAGELGQNEGKEVCLPVSHLAASCLPSA